MTIRLIPRIRATLIEANTQLPFTYIAGEAIGLKKVICKSESDGRILKADNTSWTRMPAFGVSLQSKSQGESIEVAQFGVITDITRDADFNYDDKVFVGEDGETTKSPPETSGTICQSIGRAINSSDIILQIDPTIVEITS